MTDPVLSLRDARLTLMGNAGPVEILRGITLDVRRGETLGLVGPSGSGKSSLLMLMGGLERASAGTVRVLGQDLTGLSEDALARVRRDHMGVVFQSFHLIPTMTALENVATPLELAGHADAFERAFIVELMGRHSGHITFNVGISCAAEQVLSFENFQSTDEQTTLSNIAKQVAIAQQARHTSFIIVVAENLWPGGSQKLAEDLTQLTGIDCPLCTLGYIQRGGSPVAKDRILATRMGVAAVQAVMDNKSNMMIGEQNNAMVLVPLTEAIKHQKRVSQTLVDAQQNILALNAHTSGIL